jgi:hypothetical protein
MQSVSSTNLLRSAFIGALSLTAVSSFAQINSPYSRYGLGDVNLSGNALSRALGGLTAPYTDLQSVNFLNPASYSNIKWVTFDVGAEIENRSTRNQAKTVKYNTGNFAFNYVTLGLPLSKKHNWGFAFGLRPVSRINYKIQTNERLRTSQMLNDSVVTLYEGNGGTYKAFLGSGIKIGGFSIGANFGYHFGQQQLSTRRIFIADSANVAYYKSNHANDVSLGSMFLETGIQYQAALGKDVFLQLGATYNLQHDLKGSRDVTRETYDYDANSNIYTIDSIYNTGGQEGKVNFPTTYSAGISLQKANEWMLGVQYDAAKWADYTYYGLKEPVANSYTFRVGGQVTPAITSTSFFKRLTYRGGFYFGKDYINLNNNQLPVYAATFGVGIPVYHNNYALRQYLTTINVGLEIGARGNNTSALKENFFRLHIGFSLSDLSWFQKRKYD